MSHGNEETASYMDGAAMANITRLDRASPPLTGTFSAGIYGGVAEGTVQKPAFVFTAAENYHPVLFFNAKLESSSDT